MEDLIERRLVQVGDPTAVAAYRTARTQIAKAHDIESVTDAAGNVDARALARLGGKRPLTGGLRTIADTAESFPKSMQVPSKFGGVEKHSVLDFVPAVMSSIAGMVTHNPMYALGAAAPLARPLARSYSLSNFLQNRLLGLRQVSQTGNAMRQGAAPALAGNNALRGMIGQPGQPATIPAGVPAVPGQGPQIPQGY